MASNRCQCGEPAYVGHECTAPGVASFKLSITLGNEAMQTPHDIARALRKIATRLDAMSSEAFADDGSTTARIGDDNGNKVGEWRVGEWRTE